MRDYPKDVVRVYDNGGVTWDRYTVYYKWHRGDVIRFHEFIGMSEDPFHGFGQHGTGMLGKHNGKIINFFDLPEVCRALVLQDLNLSPMEVTK